MNDVEVIGEELREAITQFLVPLRTVRIVDQFAFDKLEHAARLLTAKLKGNDLISKSLLKELYATAGIIRAQAPYLKAETAKLEQMADQIQMIFDLIIWDESYDDRKSGVPRVS